MISILFSTALFSWRAMIYSLCSFFFSYVNLINSLEAESMSSRNSYVIPIFNPCNMIVGICEMINSKWFSVCTCSYIMGLGNTIPSADIFITWPPSTISEKWGVVYSTSNIVPSFFPSMDILSAATITIYVHCCNSLNYFFIFLRISSCSCAIF